MNQLLKDKIHYYLPHGLKMQQMSSDGTPCSGPLTGKLNMHNYELFDANWGYFKPLMRPLKSLTKAIVVPGYNDGKPFVPIKELYDINHAPNAYDVLEYSVVDMNMRISLDKAQSTLRHFHFRDGGFHLYNPNNGMRYRLAMQLERFELLFSWHFWLWDQKLFETGDIIKIEDVCSDEEQVFSCKGCGHELPINYEDQTPGYCYLCEERINSEEHLGRSE